MYLIKLVIKYKIKSDTWIINHVVLFPDSIQQSNPKIRTISCNMYSSVQHTCSLSGCLLEPFLRHVYISYLSVWYAAKIYWKQNNRKRVPLTQPQIVKKYRSFLWFVLAFKALFKAIDWLVWISFQKRNERKMHSLISICVFTL